MFNKTKRVLSFSLALALVFSLAGCKKTPADEGSSAEVEYVTEYVTQEGEGGSGTGGSGTGTGGQGGSGTGGQGGSGTGGSTTTNTDNKVDLKKLKGTTVVFATTVDPKSDGTQYVIDNFEKKYDIKVKTEIYPFTEVVDTTVNNLYLQKMQVDIKNGESADVGRSNGDFPACLNYFQPLSTAKIDMTDSIWNQNTFKMSTFNGMTYMCDTIGNYWTEYDLISYSKSKLEEAGCKTPEEYAAEGNWTWDSYVEIAKQLYDYYGKPMASFYDMEGAFYIGGSVYKIENEKFVSKIDSRATEMMVAYSEARKAGYINIKGNEGFLDGNTAICTDHLWALRNDSRIATGGVKKGDMGFWFMPAFKKGEEAVTTGIFRGFGVVRGAKNPEGAGVFLRYYLDIKNYDMSKAFINADAKNFFYQLTGAENNNYNPYITYGNLNTPISGVDYKTEIFQKMADDQSVITSNMAAISAAAQNAANKLNEFVSKMVEQDAKKYK